MQAAQQAARAVAFRLRANGHASYLVGGCVRDLLLGRKPKDFDVATSATPEAVARLFPKAEQVGAHFGVVLVREAGIEIEVATFRSDLGYTDGRHPVGVRFEADPRADAVRRDFTINALFLDPESGGILDFVGGRADLESGIIRAIGDPELRFQEDHLRLLRAVRFAARLGFQIDPATMAAMRKLAPAVRHVAVERVRDEIARILTEGAARRGFELLDESGLLSHVLPEIAAMKGVEQPPEFHPEGDVWIHTLIMLEGLPAGTSLELALGVLLHDVGKPGTFRIADRIRFDGHVEKGVAIGRELMTRLKFPNRTMEAVEALIANHMKFRDAPKMRQSRLKRFLRLPDFDEHLALHRLDCLSSHGHLDNYDFCRAQLEALQPEELRPPRLISGADLIAAGFQPGPAFAEALAAVEDAQLEGTVTDRAEALRVAAARFEQAPS
jgi:poly(A) polymerase